VCLDVAREAMQMYSTGVALPAIRATIEGRYRAAYRSMTPTPPIRRP
jgi:uncharacterized protein with PCYCGC motif